MEKKFLTYLLYITLLEIRDHSYVNGNERFYWLTDILHNIPLKLDSDEEIQEAYADILDKVKKLGIDSWLKERRKEFDSRYPEYKQD